MAQERIETRMILREGEEAATYEGRLDLRVPADHVKKFLEERIGLGRRLSILLLKNDSQWRDAVQRLRIWNAFNVSELGRFIGSEEAMAAYRDSVAAPDPGTALPDRAAVFQAAARAPLGVLLGLYGRVSDL